jgi:hypothetical protein
MKIKPPRVELFVLLVCAAAAYLVANATWERSESILSATATLVLLALLTEAGSFKLGVGTSRTSVAFIPYLAAILLVGPAWAMLVAGFTLLISETLFRRKPAVKIAFNTAKEIIAVGLSGYVYVALGGVPSITVFEPKLLAFIVAVAVFFPLDQGAIALAVAISTKSRIRQVWGRLVGDHHPYDFVSSSLALLVVFLYVRLEFVGLIIVAVPLILVRHVYQMAIRLDQVNRDLLELMVKSIEARDPYTSGHSVRVSRFARTIAEELGLSAKQIHQIGTAALLHDLGKIYQEFAPILRKEGKLEPREVRLMQSHPVKGSELIGTVSSLRGDVQNAVRHHHEAFGGRGYPDRLSGQEIPLAARIIAVVDTFDAMTTTRPYRSALSREAAFAELQSMVGRQFDPKIVDLFCTNERMALVIEEALRERPVPEAQEIAHTGALSADGPVQGDDEASQPRRRWIPRPSMDGVSEGKGLGRDKRTA